MKSLYPLFPQSGSLFLLLYYFSLVCYSQQNKEDVDSIYSLIKTDIKAADSLFKSLEQSYLTAEVDSVYAHFYAAGGLINYYNHRSKLSANYYKKALNTRYSDENLPFKARMYNNLGIALELSMEFDKSYAAYNKSFKLEQKISNNYGAMETKMNIGLLFINSKNYVDANKLLLEALNYFSTDSIDSNKVALCYQNLGKLNASISNYTMADSLTSIALKYFNQMGNAEGILECLNNRVHHNLELKNINLARYYLNQCKVYDTTDTYFFNTVLPLLEARVLHAEGYSKTALSTLKKLLEQHRNNLVITHQISELEMEIYANSGNGQQFSEAFDRYKLSLDSLEARNDQKLLKQLETIYKIDRIKQDLTNKEILLNKEKKNKWIVSVASFLIIGLLALVVFFKQKLSSIKSALINTLNKKQLDESANHNAARLHPLFIKTIRYLKDEEKFLDSELKIDQVSFNVGTNNTTLSKIIREATDNNFSHLINSMRVRYAQKLLLVRSSSISEVAELAGFTNRVSFYRAFKLINGISPQEYKDSFKKP